MVAPEPAIPSLGEEPPASAEIQAFMNDTLGLKGDWVVCKITPDGTETALKCAVSVADFKPMGHRIAALNEMLGHDGTKGKKPKIGLCPWSRILTHRTKDDEHSQYGLMLTSPEFIEPLMKDTAKLDELRGTYGSIDARITDLAKSYANTPEITLGSRAWKPSTWTDRIFGPVNENGRPPRGRGE